MLGWLGTVMLWVDPRKALFRGVTQFSARTGRDGAFAVIVWVPRTLSRA